MGRTRARPLGRAPLSREAVLAALRSARPAGAAPALPPAAPPDRPAPPDAAALRARFVERLLEAGGSCLVLASPALLDAALDRVAGFAAAQRRVSLVPGAGRPTGRSPGSAALGSDPHGMADVDFALLPGELGVAESGAVWVREPEGAPRSLLFLAQHVGLVLPADALVHDLHDAYERLAPGLGRGGFGCFVCGPSKTADIEQALVVGAHGPRSLTVLLVEEGATGAGAR